MAGLFPAEDQRGFWRSSLALLGLGALAVGCGGNADDNDTSERSALPPILSVSGQRPDDFFASASGSTPGANENAPTPSADPNTPLAPPANAELCGGNFQACGGVLAGTWGVEGVCASAPPDPATLQSWAQSFLGLDPQMCPDAVETLDSDWGGQLRFTGGEAIDLRRRSEHAELRLTSDCLSKTFDVSVRPNRLEQVCSELTSDSMSCSALADGCHCSVRRERPPRGAATYGVLGTSVAIGPDRPPSIYDYCVLDDILLWRELDAGQLLVLRRQLQ